MKTRTIGLTTAALATQSAAWWWWWRQDATIARENGPMENLQAAAILAGLAFLIAGVLRASSAATRVCLTGLALFYFDFLLMEVDTRKLGVPWLAFLCNGVPRGVLLGSLWLCAGIWFCRHWRETLLVFRQNLFAAPGAWLAVSCFFWILGRLAEELNIDYSTRLFVEEIPEVAAAVLMAIAGFAWSRALAAGTIRDAATAPAAATRAGAND